MDEPDEQEPGPDPADYPVGLVSAGIMIVLSTIDRFLVRGQDFTPTWLAALLFAACLTALTANLLVWLAIRLARGEDQR